MISACFDVASTLKEDFHRHRDPNLTAVATLRIKNGKSGMKRRSSSPKGARYHGLGVSMAGGRGTARLLLIAVSSSSSKKTLHPVRFSRLFVGKLSKTGEQVAFCVGNGLRLVDLRYLGTYQRLRELLRSVNYGGVRTPKP